MGTAVNRHSAAANDASSSRIAAVLRRAPLTMMTVIFTLISFRFFVHRVRSAAQAGISFTAPGGITIAQVAFAAFSLALAILAFSSLISMRWRLAGLYMVLTVDSVVMAIRIFGSWRDHSTASAPLLAPEAVLLGLSILAIRLESAWLLRQQNIAGL